MNIKSGNYGASIAGIRPEAVLGIVVCLMTFNELHYLFQLSSGLEGKHGRGSLHFVGQAFDISANMIPTEEHATLTRLLKDRLGDEFDVVYEQSHWHIEFQPKRRLP